MTRYYLGTPVEPIGDPQDGWQWAEWPDGRRFKHRAAQLLVFPWRDWVLCFEQWPDARFHIRRPGEAFQPFFCGLYDKNVLPIRFEDELGEDEMCRTCRKRALAQAEREAAQPNHERGRG